jgi:hypothetical protein
MSAPINATERQKATIGIIALGYWSAALTNGALRVVVPVYFTSVGVPISTIAFLFFLFKFAEIFAPLGIHPQPDLDLLFGPKLSAAIH